MVTRSPEVVGSAAPVVMDGARLGSEVGGGWNAVVVINAGPVVGVGPSLDGGTPQMQMPQTGVGVGSWVVVWPSRCGIMLVVGMLVV